VAAIFGSYCARETGGDREGQMEGAKIGGIA
jgi:hypothetical protein